MYCVYVFLAGAILEKSYRLWGLVRMETDISPGEFLFTSFYFFLLHHVFDGVPPSVCHLESKLHQRWSIFTFIHVTLSRVFIDKDISL